MAAQLRMAVRIDNATQAGDQDTGAPPHRVGKVNGETVGNGKERGHNDDFVAA